MQIITIIYPRVDAAYGTHNVGVLYSKPSECLNGYTSIAPIRHEEAYLVDMSGEVVHSETSGVWLGAKAYLIPNGNLLCCLYTNRRGSHKGCQGWPYPGVRLGR